MATIGSDSASAHIIEQVTFDFSFVSDAIAYEHESQLSTWVVNALLPIVETILNEHDETGSVLYIEQITLDLGEVSGADYPLQVMQKLKEQFSRQLNEIMRSVYRQPVVLPFSQLSAVTAPNATDTALHVNMLQSGFDRLKQFLLTGNLPWHIDASGAHEHEKLLEQVLQEAQTTAALRALLTQMPQTSRAVFIWRMVNQFPAGMLETMLRHVEPQHHRLLLDLIKAFQSVLSASALPAVKYSNAMAVLWARIIDSVARHAHLPHSAHFSTVIIQLLQTMAAQVLHEEKDALLGRLINAARIIQGTDGQLPKILSAIAKRNFQAFAQTNRFGNIAQQSSLPVYAGTTQTGTVLEPVNSIRRAENKAIARNLPFSIWLYRRIVTAIQQAGVRAAAHYSETEQPADTQALQIRLLGMLQDAAIRAQLIARLSRPVLMDIVFTLSPQAAFIIEQLDSNASRLYRLTAHRRGTIRVPFDDWVSGFWDNALRVVAATSLTGEFAASGFVRALTQQLYADTDSSTLLQFWYESLEQIHYRNNDYESRILRNIIAEAIAYPLFSKPEPSIARAGLAAACIAPADATETEHYFDHITWRIVSALQHAAIAGTEQFAAQSGIFGAQANRQWLPVMLADTAMRNRLIARLPESVLIDIVYRLSPQAADLLTQILAHAEVLYQSVIDRRSRNTDIDTDLSIWRRRVIANALDFLSSKQGGSLSNGAWNATDFVLAMTQGLSASHGDTAILQLWHDGLRSQPQQKAEHNTDRILVYSIGEAVPAAATEDASAVVIEEMRQIATGLEVDFARQLLRLKTAFENGRLLPGAIPEPELESMIHGILKQYPGSTDTNRSALVDAIGNHARHTVNRTGYYYRVLKQLVYGENIDLEAIVSDLEPQQAHPLDASTQTAATAEKPFTSVPQSNSIMQHLQIALRQAGITGFPAELLETNPIASVSALWADYLLDQNKRRQLITWLPQSALLDISYVLSPQAALILVRLLQHAEELLQHTENTRHTTRTAWQQQVWDNALRFLADATLTGTFNMSLFIQTLTQKLSDNDDVESVLRSWLAALQALQDKQYGYETNVLQNRILDAISALPALRRQAVLSGEQTGLIAETRTADYHTLKQRLRSALDDGQLVLATLSETTARALVQVMLERDAQLTESDRRLFIEAIASHTPKSGSSAAYFQLILRQLLLEKTIDLDAIAAQAETTGSSASAEQADATEAGFFNEDISQRISLALRRAAIDGTEQYLEQFMQSGDAADALVLLDNTALRKQLIEQLPESILLDITYMVSPQSAFILSHWLSHAEFFRRHAGSTGHVTPDVWIKQIWESGLKALLTAPASGAVDDVSAAVNFVRVLIQDLAGSEGASRLTRLWHYALTQALENAYKRTQKNANETAGGIIVLAHLLHGVLIEHSDDFSAQSEKSIKMRDSSASFTSDITSDLQFSRLTAFELNTDEFEEQTGDAYYLHNAGLILAAPYLPRLFRMLGWLDTEGFIGTPAAERAVHLLQYMVSQEPRPPEYQLVLNKILCGLPLAMPVGREIELSVHELETVEDLLHGMIRNWKVLGKTSISGLQETFLQRKGQLLLQEEIWFLTIAPGPFDMLLDQLPWSFSVIKHNWMPRAVHVTWR
ncbi:hypothetical protein SAMN05421690_100457 [Nitrosomonas sp. Nm51]|uniref:contractile injection system tape measure protein n=1 Tax=Nitrosomonas sp. Nm51 TaxID=133720 RepID=UPI0008AEA6B5|nr:contractile injection system tape measure protein [Nitrosomonas sp. Nm51]SEQ95416.1 hypothetical protein SAMN05421690_100457 [Nitrosomonas sp. Nm51]